MNINSGTITIVIALAAIISPILVALINNAHHSKMERLSLAHQEKIKEMDFQAKRKDESLKYLRSIFENYLQSASRCIASPTPDNLKIYGEHYSISFIYFPSAAHEKLEDINYLIRKHDWEGANAKLEEFSIWLAPLMNDILKS